jgi:hypothetical protein
MGFSASHNVDRPPQCPNNATHKRDTRFVGRKAADSADSANREFDAGALESSNDGGYSHFVAKKHTIYAKAGGLIP